MTTEQVYVGLVLTVGLAVGCQILGAKLRIPALILLLPAGFAAGAVTDDVNPNNLLGASFQPLVSLAVAIILYDAGLGLNLSKLAGHKRRVVLRLLLLGVPITWAAATVLSRPLFGMEKGVALMFGAILVVSGPTVVGPLLGFVRPTERLRHVLIWEGSLIDPIGALLGAVVYHAVVASAPSRHGQQVAHFALSFVVGVVGAAVGFGLLWLLLRRMGLGETTGTLAQLAVVVVVAGLCDIVREDTGLIAAIGMGLALANTRGFDLPARRPFFEVLVQLIIGLLFISISATVTPASVVHLLLPALALVAVLVLVVRPVVAAVSTLRTDLPRRERAFVGWMAPRGIVAAATASTFAAGLVRGGFTGADKILPGTFLVIVMTVMLYGLTAAPVARLLDVVRRRATRPLIVGGQPWTVDLATTLRDGGMDVVMWADHSEHREAIRERGIGLAPEDLIAGATGPGAEIEGFTDILFLTDGHAFNVVASEMLGGGEESRVYRLGAPADLRTGAIGRTPDAILFPTLGDDFMAAEYAAGARFAITAGDPSGDRRLLFRVRADGTLVPVTAAESPAPRPGDSAVHFGRSG